MCELYPAHEEAAHERDTPDGLGWHDIGIVGRDDDIVWIDRDTHERRREAKQIDHAGSVGGVQRNEPGLFGRTPRRKATRANENRDYSTSRHRHEYREKWRGHSIQPANDIEFSGEPQSQKKREEGTRVRCNEVLGASVRKPEMHPSLRAFPESYRA